MASQGLQQNTGLLADEYSVSYDGYLNDGTTVVAADVPVGGIVCLKDAPNSLGALVVGRPETATLENTKFIVSAVSREVNEIIDTSTNRRRGGIIKVIPVRGAIGFQDVLVADGVAAADAIIPVNGSFAGAAATSVASVAAIAAYIGYARVANSSGANALRRVQLGIFQ
jgi:hypothetical protein